MAKKRDGDNRKISSMKGSSTGQNKLAYKIAAVSVSVLIIALSFIALNNADKSARQTVSVAQIKGGIEQYAAFTKDNIVKYDIIKKEYSKDMILYDDKIDEIYGLLAAYKLRGDTVLYKDQITEERLKRNEWLYEMSEDLEALTLPYKSAEAGGDILMPGDEIRVRVVYQDIIIDEETGMERDIVRSEVLFDRVQVTDMLNSSGHSVYEVYSEVLKLDEASKQVAMETKEFMTAIKPNALMILGLPEEVEAFAEKKLKVDNGSLLITILSRANNSDVILDQVPTLESEVKTWLKESRK